VAEPRTALVILDGLGDRPHPDTGNLSPVEAAATPNLDRLLARGASGRVSILGPGVAPESDAGVFALLGYDPVRDSPGRGVLEAQGAGIELGRGDVALRLNFATSDGGRRILDSRVGRSLSTKEAQALAEALTRADLLGDHRVRAEVRATVGHRGVLWLSPQDGRPLSGAISNADPFYEKVGGMGKARANPEPIVPDVLPLEATPEAERAATAVNAFLGRAGAVLTAHPVNARRALAGKPIANALLLRNAGGVPVEPTLTFEEKHHMAGAAITEMPVERGIARTLGLLDMFVGPMGTDRSAGFRERARLVRQALRERPFVYVHLKGPDEPGHDGNAVLKREIVEAIDRDFFGPLLEGIDLDRVRLAVTADHATPCVLKAHSDDPVPLLVVGAGVSPPPRSSTSDRPPKFGRTGADSSGLGELRAVDVLDLLFGRRPFPGA
jgi:2,3-bisphosphoglycerate-independent phosphoglycerate mutase